MLGNFGARGKQEHGRELCADFYGFLPAFNFHLQCYRLRCFCFARTFDFFIVFARFLALTPEVCQANGHRRRQELTINQSKTTLLRSRNQKKESERPGLLKSRPTLEQEAFWGLSGPCPERLLALPLSM